MMEKEPIREVRRFIGPNGKKLELTIKADEQYIIDGFMKLVTDNSKIFISNDIDDEIEEIIRNMENLEK